MFAAAAAYNVHVSLCLCVAGMYQLLSASTSLMHVNIDGCARISLASCPPHFIAFDGVVGSSQLTDTSGVRRPGVLVRVPT